MIRSVAGSDFGSSDGTAEWLEELAARDERVRAIRCDHNLGVGAARNCGLRQARGRYVVLLDSSVELTGDLLSPLAEALEDGPAGRGGAVCVNTEAPRAFA